MNAYNKLQSIGHSAHAEVFIVEDRLTRARYVMKQMQLRSDDREFALRESALLRTLHHPNICRHHESFVHNGDWLCVVMPHCSNGDLAQLFKQRRDRLLPPLDEAVSVHYLMSIALALQYLHDRKVIHRDVKPSNIFLASDWTVQLGDFGVSRQLSDTSSLASTCVGTPLYMSPELLQSNRHSTKTDLWALGCVGFECATLQPAFTGASFTEIAEKVISGEYGRLPARTSVPFRDTIGRLLSVSPDARPSAKQLLNSLLLRRPLRAHLARLDAGDAGGMSAAAGYSEPRSPPLPSSDDAPREGDTTPGSCERGGSGSQQPQLKRASGSASASRAARRAAVPSPEERPPVPRRASSSGVELSSNDRLRRALNRRMEIQRYLNETQQRRSRRRRPGDAGYQQFDGSLHAGGNGDQPAGDEGSLGLEGARVFVERPHDNNVLQDTYKLALRMLETGAATDYSSAMLAASEDAMRVTMPISRPAAADGENAAAHAAEEEASAELRLEGDLERTLRECELTIQLLSLQSIAAPGADEEPEGAPAADQSGTSRLHRR